MGNLKVGGAGPLARGNGTRNYELPREQRIEADLTRVAFCDRVRCYET